MNKVLLLRPKQRPSRSSLEPVYPRKWPPLDLLNSSALLTENGIENRLLDMVVEKFKGSQLDFILKRTQEGQLILATSSSLDQWQCPTRNIKDYIDICRGLSKKGRKVILAGFHPTIAPKKLLSMTRAHALIMGEPENAIVPLAQGQNGGTVPGTAALVDGRYFQGPKAPQLNMNIIKVIPWDKCPRPWPYQYEPLGKPFALLEIKRGCLWNCGFCAKDTMYGKGTRSRDNALVLGQIQDLLDRGIKYIYFMDLDFLSQKKEALEICRALAKLPEKPRFAVQTRPEGMDRKTAEILASGGCELIHFGVESLSHQIMEKTGKIYTKATLYKALKICRENRIKTACFFMYGLPGEGPFQALQTLYRSILLPTDLGNYHIAVPYPQTPMRSMNFARENIFLRSLIRASTLAFYGWPPRFFRNITRINLDTISGMAKILGLFPQ